MNPKIPNVSYMSKQNYKQRLRSGGYTFSHKLKKKNNSKNYFIAFFAKLVLFVFKIFKLCLYIFKNM